MEPSGIGRIFATTPRSRERLSHGVHDKFLIPAQLTDHVPSLKIIRPLTL